MNEHDIGTIEIIRTIFRPILIGMLILGAFFLIINEFDTYWSNTWIALAIFGGGEWILERPVIKILSNIRLKENNK